MANIVRLGLIAPLLSLIVAASARQTITYTVQPGDSLYTIAHKHGLRLPELLKVNKLRNPHALQVGDKILIPVKGNAVVRTASAPTVPPASGWAEINRDRINIRSAPSVRAERITIVDRWTKVRVLGREGEWSRVRLQTGRVGWVLSQYLSPTKPPVSRTLAKSSAPKRATQARRRAAEPKLATRNPSRAQQLASASGEQPSA
ncbi:MAG: LysM peptidoglycan-binding domain-containing protein, partial [Fimbriimonadales bacterium]|nr:LysM peptidoglycan-binding domain-containing protein [Fimbriimonadales bacterium]